MRISILNLATGDDGMETNTRMTDWVRGTRLILINIVQAKRSVYL